MNEKEKQRLKTLLSDGFYFPRELPPQFTTAQFAKSSVEEDILNAEKNESPRSKFSAESYSVPKLGGGRRRLSIVNPLAQMRVAKIVAKCWDTIRKHFTKSECSAHIPKIDEKKSFGHSEYQEFERRKIEIFARHSTVVSVDILRFYETIYTHAIAWALHGKTAIKRMSHQQRTKKDGDLLDCAIRNGQDGQSIGLPIGPYTSRIVSEIIGVAIDESLEKKWGYNQDRAARLIDDWVVGADSNKSPNKIIADFSARCRDFGFDLNLEKTKIACPTDSLTPDWLAELWNWSQNTKQCADKEAISHFFAKAFFFAKKYPRQGVLKYAVHCADSWPVKAENWERLEGYLLVAVRNNPSIIGSVAKTLAKSRENVNPQQIKGLIHDLIRDNADLDHHFEVSWALSLAKEFKLHLDDNVARCVCQTDSSVCALLLLDLFDQELVEISTDADYKLRTRLDSGLQSDRWLLTYEAAMQKWLSPLTDESKELFDNPYFEALRTNDVFFYNKEKTIAGEDQKSEDSAKIAKVALY